MIAKSYLRFLLSTIFSSLPTYCILKIINGLPAHLNAESETEMQQTSSISIRKYCPYSKSASRIEESQSSGKNREIKLVFLFFFFLIKI